MLLWTLTFLGFLLTCQSLFGDRINYSQLGRGSKERRDLRIVRQKLHEIQELLESGFLPEEERWNSLQQLPSPWGKLAFGSTRLLRTHGGSVLPTLRRLRTFAESHSASIGEAQARVSQALAQAWICALMVPVFGFALYELLPGVSDHATTWTIACLGALGLAAQGGFWLARMADRARWGGLKSHQRSWQLLGPCAVEEFLALLRAGTPADLAWTQCLDHLAQDAPELARAWGHSVWSPTEKASSAGTFGIGAAGAAARTWADAGIDLRKAVQVSLLEGRPCQDRIETALSGLKQELSAQVDRELTLLGTRGLKPLFLCVAPSLFGLLLLGMFFGWEQASGGWNG